MVMVALSVENDSVVVMMSVPVTDANSDAADTYLDGFRDHNRLVADVQRPGKCRYCQKRDKK
jgi:hypothetical protein